MTLAELKAIAQEHPEALYVFRVICLQYDNDKRGKGFITA